MKHSTYDFRQFQEELAALDRKSNPSAKESPAPRKESVHSRLALAQAKAEFMVLRDRYGLTIADVVAFFPEEEGIGYLQTLIAAKEDTTKSSPRKRGGLS
jgi:hypothetical protein